VIVVARTITLLATLAIASVSCWEIAAPFGAGHYAASTAVMTSGENMWRFGTLGPVPRYLPDPPVPADYYCHHPWGIFWVAALFVGVLGHHDIVCRLPAALLSTAMPILLYGAGRALWGPVAGALAAAAYVVTPITLAYANFFSLEGPTMFAMALTTYAYVRFSQTGRRRFAVVTVLGLVLAASFDWTGFMFAGLVLGGLFLRGFVLRRFYPPIDFVRYATLWAMGVLLVALVAAFHLAAFAHFGQLGTFLAQGEARASGSSLPLAEVLKSRRYWILLAFTPVAIGIGKVAAPILFARMALFRREGELLPLAVLATAILQYVGFKQGADIHFFWPQYFALYFAYALGALAASAEEIAAFAVQKLAHPRFSRATTVGILAAGISIALAMAPDALRALRWARKSGGRFNEHGLIIHPDLDKAAVFSELTKTLPPDASLDVDASMKFSYWMDFALERKVGPGSFFHVRNGPTSTHFALDARFSPAATLRTLARNSAVSAYGPYWICDLDAPPEPILGFAIPRREPTAFERLFVSSNHALYSVAPDPFWTWELREHLGVAPNPVPTAVAGHSPDRRIAHNLAVALGDSSSAGRALGELLAGADRSVAREFSAGVRLLGARLTRGASDVLTVYFEASAPLATDVSFVITSTVERAPSFSLVPPDELPWNVGMPFALPTSLWRPGFVYESVTELMRRPGRERYQGSFEGPGAPVPLAGARETTLLVLE
jgi:4-amino-4-deoxy-L-arabinose transferase-like glycosyltransferase